MSFWNWLQGGRSVMSRETWGCRLACWVGHFVASRRPGVHIAPDAVISPEARICARKGEIRIGARSNIALGTMLQGNVRIGEDCSVQAYGNIVGYGGPDDETGRVTIGNGARIAANVVMIAGNHVFDDPDTPIRRQGLKQAPITVEDDCWIGARVNIMAGVTIGRGSVIGGGAVVTRDVPSMSIAVGVPARVIGSRGNETQSKDATNSTR